ncbi:MAG: UDP-N-acetylmuramoyl-L-alanine--D-glutamate ligase [Alkalilacustris sp.]
MIPVPGFEGRTVAVLGLARSGLAAARALAAGGADVVAWDDGADARDRASAEGIALRDLARPGAWDGVVRLIVSPGIPPLHPAPNAHVAAALAAGVPVDNDVGLFFRALARPEWAAMDSPPRVVAITGSNGKSTTTALVHHILTATGRPAQMGGNIGRGVLDLDPPGEGAVIVLELSSYQLELARALTPDVAVFTNLTPDHLDRHGGMGGYFAAKRRLFAEGGPDRAVIGVDQPEGRFLAGELAEAAEDLRVIRVSSGQKLVGPGWAVYARKGFLAEWRAGRQVASCDLRGLAGLPGAHNHQNACSAWAASRALGLGPRDIADALAGFAGLAHRSQTIAHRGGVRYVDDSKATNADSAGHALAAFDRIRWIAGGRAKAGGIASLTPQFERLRKVYLIGESAADFAAQLGQTPHVLCHTMAAAVAQAAAEAEEGDVVLLAPAAASFDQYPDFEARGADFAACVAALPDP